MKPLAWLVVALFAIPVAPLAADEKTARDLFPSSIVGYLEIPQPRKVLDTVLDHPLAKEIEKHPDYQKALQTREYEKLLAAIKLAEDKLGMKWRPALSSLTSGGLHVGFDLPTQGVVVLSQAEDEKLAEKARDGILDLARSAAAASGKPDPVKQDEHRGIAIYQIEDAHFTQFGKWLLATNKPLLARMILELHLAPGETLAAEEQFQTALIDRPADAAAWLYVDLRVLRLTGVLRAALNKKSDNPVIELVAGGILGAIPDAPYVTASLELDSKRLRLAAHLPCDTPAVAKKREFYFGADGDGAAPALLAPKDTLLSLSTYRDFASLWRNAPDLFDERINAKLAEAESGLTTFFAGRNFRDDILGKLQPGVQVVVVRQTFPPEGVTPAIKLPAGAIVLRMKNPEETARIFKITYQSSVGFLNVVGAMNGIDPLDLMNEQIGETKLVSTEYLPPKPETRNAAAIHFNASPTIAFAGEHVILASTRLLALELAEQVRGKLPAEAGVNTKLFIDGSRVQAALSDNRGSLIAQNMLGKGHDQAAAEKEIDSLLRALMGIDSTSLQLSADGKMLRLAVELRLAGAK